MAEQRLPAVNGDDGAWGDILNQFLGKEHYNTGLNDPLNGGHRAITIRPGTSVAGTAPIKFTSGSLLSAPEPGAVEFLSDKFYATQTTGSTRKTIAIYDDSAGTTGDLYHRDASGNFIRLPVGSTSQMLSVTGGLPSWKTVLSGTSKISVGTSTPASPTVGDLWIDTN